MVCGSIWFLSLVIMKGNKYYEIFLIYDVLEVFTTANQLLFLLVLLLRTIKILIITVMTMTTTTTTTTTIVVMIITYGAIQN
jgi:hypothetical protein